METVAEILNNWMQSMKVDYIQNYYNKGLKASGNLEQKTRVESDSTTTRMFTPQYAGALFYGRSKNANQSDEALRKFVGWAGSTIFAKWVEQKGINISPYAVAWKIARQGITVPNQYNDGKLYTDTFTTERFNKLYKDLQYTTVLNIKEQIKSTWQR